MSGLSVEEGRAALRALPEETSYGEVPAPKLVYLPPSHLKALDPDRQLVTGMRGAGKTFWWSALQEAAVRELVRQHDERSALGVETEVRTGFGAKPAPEEYPDKDVLAKLIGDGLEPRVLWRTVQARQIAPLGHPLLEQDAWSKRGEWVRSHPEELAQLFEERDRDFERRRVHFLVLFDALDRCADDWKTMFRLIRGLLQSVLDLRSYRRLRAKVFLRSDQFSESEIGDFPDASKLLSSRAELNWPRSELYGLLWHVLANGLHGEKFRGFLRAGRWNSAEIQQLSLFSVPRSLIREEEDQEQKFHALAGQWMGRDHRRGLPYSWIHGHLADTEGRVSPRSFIAALRAAAEDTADRYPQHETALHYESIKRGVREASKIRVQELQEDYPWVDRVLRPLRGMVVPCSFEEIEDRWKGEGGVRSLIEEGMEGEVKLPPRRFERGAEGIRLDLEALSVIQRMTDGRVNMPDVFRVGYGLGRRGGVRPAR